MRKLIYSLIASFMFVAPIWYWLATWWGVTLDRPPSFRRFVYIYSNDNTIVIITGVNVVLYLLAMWKILTLKSTMGNGAVKTGTKGGVGNGNGGNSAVNPILNLHGNANGTDMNRWESLYGEKAKARMNTPASGATATAMPTTAAATMPQAQAQSQTQAQAQVASVQDSQPVADVAGARGNAVPTPNVAGDAKKDNVVDIAPVTANDVYKIQIKNMLADGGYETIGSCVIKGTEIDFVAVAESDTLVLGVIDCEYGEIIANDTVPLSDEPEMWYTSERKYNSPVWEVRKAADEAKRMIDSVLPKDNAVSVVPIVVVPSATIMNYDDVKNVWEKLGVRVARFMNKTELPDLLEALPDKAETTVLESYKTFAVTLLKYFKGKSGVKTKRNVG